MIERTLLSWMSLGFDWMKGKTECDQTWSIFELKTIFYCWIFNQNYFLSQSKKKDFPIAKSGHVSSELKSYKLKYNPYERSDEIIMLKKKFEMRISQITISYQS
jgi:hypothetical protein